MVSKHQKNYLKKSWKKSRHNIFSKTCRKTIDKIYDRVKNEKVLESPEKLLYATVGLFPKSLDTLQAESGMKRTDMVHALVSLEMKGYIREISRNHFVKA